MRVPAPPERGGSGIQRLWMLIALLGGVPAVLAAQEPSGESVVVDPAAGSEPHLGADAEAGDGSGRKTGKSVTPLIAPIPFKNTQLGWGLMLMGGLIHRFDTSSTTKPSTGMIGGFYTENGSWGVMAMENARLAADRWRLRGMLSHMDVRYDFYGVGEEAGAAGRSIAIQQDMNLAQVVGLRRVARDLYLGAAAVYMGATVAIRDTSGVPLPPALPDTSDVTLFAPGIQGEADTRSDDYWPTHGTLARLKGWFFVKGLGGERAFQRYLAYWSWYHPLHEERLILASNVNACGTAGDTPFWALCSIGAGRGGLRGYTQGRYRDTVMTTVQAELRYRVHGRWGAAAFAGFGQVAPDFGGIFDAKVLPAGGLGLRYQLTSKYPMNMRFDYAWGVDGALFYFGVTEAF